MNDMQIAYTIVLAAMLIAPLLMLLINERDRKRSKQARRA